MQGYLRQSSAAQVRTLGPFLDSTTFVDFENALTIANTDIKLKKNGAASVNKNSGGATADGTFGMYHLTWDAVDSATVGELFVCVSVAGALPVFATYVVLEEAVYDQLYAAAAPGAATTAQATDLQARLPAALVSGRMDASVGAMAANVLTATAINADAITAAKIAPDAIGASEFAQAAADKVWATAARTVTAATNITSTGGTTVPQTGDSFARLGAPVGASISADVAAVKTQTGAIETDTQDIQTRLPAALVSGRMSSDAVAISGSTAAADAVEANIANLDVAVSSRLAAAGYTAPPTVAAMADGVWDEQLAGHAAVGSAGAALTAAGSAGDPWSTVLPSAYGPSTAGFIIGNNIDVPVSTRPSAIQNADALLARDLGSGTNAGVLNERTVRSALRFLRNFWSIAAGVLTVRTEDDTTTAWTGAVTQTPGDPTSSIEPS
jgi:hypothetical protein